MWSLRNHGGYTLVMQFCSMTSTSCNLRNVALLSARCIYLLFSKKYAIKSVYVGVSTATLLTKTKVVWKCGYFSLRHLYAVWKWKTRLEEVAAIQGIVCACNKKAPLLIFTSFVCYLRQLCFVMYTESNFSYSVKSSYVTYVRLFNTEKNRSSIEKLRLWIT